MYSIVDAVSPSKIRRNKRQDKHVFPIPDTNWATNSVTCIDWSVRIKRRCGSSTAGLADVVHKNHQEGEEVKVDWIEEQFDYFQPDEHTFIAGRAFWVVDKTLNVLGLEIFSLTHFLKRNVSNGIKIGVINLTDNHDDNVATYASQDVRLACKKKQIHYLGQECAAELHKCN